MSKTSAMLRSRKGSVSRSLLAEGDKLSWLRRQGLFPVIPRSWHTATSLALDPSINNQQHSHGKKAIVRVGLDLITINQMELIQRMGILVYGKSSFNSCP